MVEGNLGTDFVARRPEFCELATEIAIQIASTGPAYIRKEDVPADVLGAQVERYKQEYIDQGKKPEIAERAAQGKLDAWLKETVLLEQVYVKDDEIKVSDLIRKGIAKIGENVVVRRFVRYQLGGE